MSITVKFTRKALVSITPAKLVDLGAAGQTLANRIRDRMTVAGLDAGGAPLPPPAQTQRGWRTRMDDERFPDGTGKPSFRGFDDRGRPYIERGGQRVPLFRYYQYGYAAAKRAAGGKPITDGKLTGAMWASLGVLVSTRNKGQSIVLRFSGSSKAGGTRVENRVKAAGWERRDPTTLKRASSRMMHILAFSDDEMAELLRAIADSYDVKIISAPG